MSTPLVADIEDLTCTFLLLQIKRSYMSVPLVANIEDLT